MVTYGVVHPLRRKKKRPRAPQFEAVLLHRCARKQIQHSVPPPPPRPPPLLSSSQLCRFSYSLFRSFFLFLCRFRSHCTRPGDSFSLSVARRSLCVRAITVCVTHKRNERRCGVFHAHTDTKRARADPHAPERTETTHDNRTTRLKTLSRAHDRAGPAKLVEPRTTTKMSTYFCILL